MDWACADCGALFDSRFAWAGAAVALAGTVRGFSGFGAALLFLPLGGALYDAKTAVLLLWVIDGVGAIPYLRPHFQRANWRDVSLLALGCAATMPFGIWVLAHGDPYWLRWGVCGTVLVYTAGLASGWRYRRSPGVAATAAVGAVTGFSSGAVGIGGPPLVLFWLAGQTDAARARSNIFAYFAVASVIQSGLYVLEGIFSAPAAALGLALTPFYIGGLFVGDKLFRFGTESLFRRVAFALCGFAAVVGMPLWR